MLRRRLPIRQTMRDIPASAIPLHIAMSQAGEEPPLPVSLPRKKQWLFAAAACVLLAGILGVLAHLNIVQLDGLKQYIPGKAEKIVNRFRIHGAKPIAPPGAVGPDEDRAIRGSDRHRDGIVEV